jgi:LytS/YehU family sensor histidine kinase
MTVAAVAVITHGYETLFLWRDWESERLRVERAERSRLQAEIDALQREADPHFLYNSLNSLVHLIDTNPERAMAFVEALAAGYRYLLDTRRRSLVPLAEEIAALERFRLLADIRFAGAVRLDLDVSEADAARWWLPPLCLPELFENALKHTAFDSTDPLRVRVRLERDVLIVSNRFRPQPPASPSTGLGLVNLDERLRLAIGRQVRWGAENGLFEVRVPLAREPAEGEQHLPA